MTGYRVVRYIGNEVVGISEWKQNQQELSCGFNDFKGGMGDIITTLLAQDKMLGIECTPKTIEGKKIKEELG